MSITKEFVTSVRRRIAENPAVLTSRLAEDLRASEADVIMALPKAMRLRADNNNFSAIWENVNTWQNMAVDLTADGSTHPQERLPNAQQLKKQLGFIWFVSKPLSGRESHSVRFFDKTGKHIVSIYTGWDINGRPDQTAKNKYDELSERFGVVPVPPIHCNGCCGCTHTNGCRSNHVDGYSAQQSAIAAS